MEYTDYQGLLMRARETPTSPKDPTCRATYTCYILCPELECELPPGHEGPHVYMLVFDDSGAQQ